MQNAQQKLEKDWNESQIQSWYNSVLAQGKKRDYADVISRINRLPANTHTVEAYAVMSDENPAFRISIGDTNNGNPNILITGGVHGYEPSGVEAAIRFAEKEAPALTDKFNFAVYPCISPWAYEYDQRWNALAQDPNRLFAHGDNIIAIEECQHFMTSMEQNGTEFAAAIDLHETCDRDVQLRILRSERFGSPLAADYQDIPQGYYLTLSKRNTENENRLQLLFGRAVINEVQKISPIAPEKSILEGKENFGGIILSAPSKGLLRTYLDGHAKLVAVTEVYPDHPQMTPEKSVQAQLASIRGVLNFISAPRL
jgi:hypothetical protein